MGTWLTGHPLLVAEFAFIFWLYAGVLAALSNPATDNRRWFMWMTVVILAVTVPARASARRDSAQLEHIGFELSMWQHDDEQRYRTAGREFSIYLPATGRDVSIPMRREPGPATPDPLFVDIVVQKRRVATVTLRGNAWQSADVTLPRQSRLFELAQFVVRAQTPVLPTVLVRVGKAVPR